ncbi:MAG: hypothetical protein M1828_002209 [Chrysothrix sp. TS-e1954]|nr:MAG: hypothetical protein M1828_002209 [Chrysothrix sp. TS-e1954]
MPLSDASSQRKRKLESGSDVAKQSKQKKQKKESVAHSFHEDTASVDGDRQQGSKRKNLQGVIQNSAEPEIPSHDDQNGGFQASVAAEKSRLPKKHKEEEKRKRRKAVEQLSKQSVKAGSDHNAITPAAEKDSEKRSKKSKKSRKDKFGEQVETQMAPREMNMIMDEAQAENGASKHTVALSAKRKQHQSKRRKRHRDPVHAEAKPWNVSEAIGGRFSDVAPIFATEQKLIAATENAVNIYSNETSLLERSLLLPEPGTISACTVSAIDPSIVYASTVTGTIIAWRWTDGENLGRIKIGRSIVDIRCTVLDGDSRDTIYTIDQSGSGRITVHRLKSKKYKLKSSEILLKTSQPLLSMQIFERGRTIIAVSTKSLHVGTLVSPASTSAVDMKYEWTEIPCPEEVVCFDAKIRETQESFPKGQRAGVEVAVGGAKGCIHVFSDILNPQTAGTNPQRLHWHREAVATVAYSPDGLYLISGGRETVLVVWQLETGRKQFLPHLESPIRSLTVAPSGSQYAVNLGDNSIIVLSTSEMKPTAHFPGLQTVNTVDRMVKQHLQPATGSTERESQSILINPSNPLELQAAVPTNSMSSSLPSSSTHLQTFGLDTQRHISRQALTRTNATDSNVGPEGTRILEPNVTHIAISSNGRWLASVEEWTPPPEDLNGLISDPSELQEVRERHKEVNLRIWSWNEADSLWALNTLVPCPHVLPDTKVASRILDLVADPVLTQFTTVAQDGTLRIWAPKTRLPDGRIIRSEPAPIASSALVSTKDQPQSKKQRKAANATRTWWTSQHVLSLESLPSSSAQHLYALPLSHARLAYTNDGSGLAVLQRFRDAASSLTYPSPPQSIDEDMSDESTTLLHLIDASSASILETRAGMDTLADPITSIAFLERYLICLCRSYAAVWDVTTWELHATIPLTTNDPVASAEPSKDGVSRTTPAPLLAINQATQSFAFIAHSPCPAISSNASKAEASYTSSLSIYNPFPPTSLIDNALHSPGTPVFTADLQTPTLSIVSPPPPPPGKEGMKDAYAAERQGYVLLNSNASLRIVRPASMAVESPEDAKSKSRSRSKSKKERRAMVQNLQSLNAPSDALAPAADPTNTSPTALDPGSDSEPQVASDDETIGFPRESHRPLRDPPVVQAEELAAAMEGPDGELASVWDMFERVVGLFGGGPDGGRASGGGDGGGG